ncbi:MAG TPA: ATP-binding cassette domain-containing protein [Erysipelotrichaceae bacterium]|nr:ATP-binding cassette domain-containing protein [Erysipelotrichaceae bacterium]
MKENNHPYVSLQHISKVYPNGIKAVHDFSLEVQKHDFLVLVGPSGCGKSTVLRMIAGLEEITSGDLYIDGVHSNDRTPKERDVAMVFQSYALYPHLSVFDNISFGLKIRRTPKNEIKERVTAAAKILQLEDYLKRKPKELSGGQRQRVALGRAIVRNAKVFLMDEPLSNLDAKLRGQMRSEIIKIHEQLNATTIYVTHDQTEAMTMATRIVVMKDGYIQQIGTPIEIYTNPSNLFVAGFIGAPAMNFIDCVYNENKSKLILNEKVSVKISKEQKEQINKFYENEIINLKLQLQKLKDNPPVITRVNKKNAKLLANHEKEITDLEIKLSAIENIKNAERKFVYGIRPEDIAICEQDKKSPPSFEIVVTVAELLGNEYYVHTDFNDKDIIAKVPANVVIRSGDVLEVYLRTEKAHLFDPVTTKRIF